MIVCGVNSGKARLLAKKQFRLVIKLLVEEKLLKRLSGIFSLILQNEKYQFFQIAKASSLNTAHYWQFNNECSVILHVIQ